MKRVLLFVVSILLILMFILQMGLTDIPKTMSYQGLLTNASGVPVADGNYSLTFKLYSTDLGGAALWTEAHPSVTVIKGIFNVILGSGGSSLNLPFDQQYWLGITVGAGAELTPRVKLTATPYSLNAQSVSDGAVTTSKLADNAVTTAKIQPNVVSSVDGVSNDGGNIDLIPQNAITVTPNDAANTITIGESHSARTDNPHSTTAAQAGALVSVEGVSNAGGNVNLIPQNAIIINPSDAANTITIGENHSSGTDNPHSVTASQVGAWSLTGNSGTSGKFLGTTDNKALELKVNGVRALKLEPNSTSANLIGGYSGNSVSSGVLGATISGGGKSSGSIISYRNWVTDDFGTVGGGALNQAGDGTGATDFMVYATVGGGWSNRATSSYATIGGGNNNEAKYAATVSGGTDNTASMNWATVSGGNNNTSSGMGAMIPGGSYNIAQGAFSFAAGYRAKSLHNGAFVWGDYYGADLNSERDNQFKVRCRGGAHFISGISTGGIITIAGVLLNPGSSAWSPGCSRNIKDNFTPVDGRDILKRLASISIQTWNYKTQEPSIRHIGPMAQDFYDIFGIGEDNEHISTIDSDGVALAAIQGLYEIIQEKDEKITSQQQQINSLEVRLAALEKLVSESK